MSTGRQAHSSTQPAFDEYAEHYQEMLQRGVGLSARVKSREVV